MDEQGKKKVIAATQRARMAPQMSLGLRRGRERNSATEWLMRHPEILEHLLQFEAEMEARGIQPADMRRVKQPFDYD